MSDIGTLAGCLVDGDRESLARARRLRRKALLISLFLEAGLVAVMLLAPLVTPGVLPRQYISTPLPPFHGGGAGASHPHEAIHRPPIIDRHPICLFCAPQLKLPHSSAGEDLNPPEIDAGSGPALGDGPAGGGPLVDGGTGKGAQPFVVHKPEPPRQPATVHRSEGVMEGMLIHRVQPEYPPLARAAHISGTVELRAIIARDGTIRDLQVVSGNPLLMHAAAAAVHEWRYIPTLLSGEPVEVETYITVKFILE